MNTRTIGTQKEQVAAKYLEENGMHIVEQNFRCRQGEIDLIGTHEGYLVFVEVKYRKSKDYGTALEAVNTSKQRRICAVSDYYRYIHHYRQDMAVRYDVLAIQGEKICWIQNAFPYVPGRRI